MKLVKFSVEKYRSIIKRSQFSIFDKTVIIGPNNEGKSNIMRALVCALNILRFFTESTKTLQLDGKTITLPKTILMHDMFYEWEKDYPIPLKHTRGSKENKKSIFILEFELNDEENSNFRTLTLTNLKDPVIPIRLEVSEANIRFTLNIPGHFYKKASKTKMIQIANFITNKINICYIDAERTASTAAESIGGLLDMQIRQIQENDDYKKLLQQLRQLYIPTLEKTSDKVNELLKNFIPSINGTKITLDDNIYPQRFYRRHSFSVEINDGVNTPLERKGSGLQSMIALFLAQYVSETLHKSENFILAIDEPESHLHPQGIHDIKKILDDIALNNQVIIATHSPLLAETNNPHKNIIVKDNYAQEAEHIKKVRDTLGVHPTDNLISAEMVLLVEGASDENMLPHILSLQSAVLKDAIRDHRLVIQSCGGTHQMGHYVNFMRNQLCNIHVFVDDDEAGKQFIREMKQKGNIKESEFTILRMPGLPNSEIENLFKPDVYSSVIAEAYGLDSATIESTCSENRQWSLSMKDIFLKAGKTWDRNTEIKLKTLVSEALKKTESFQLIEYRKSAFVSGCAALERYFKR